MADVEIDLEITNPNELTGLGIRAFAIGDFSNAAAAFAKASQILSEKHGDEHDSLGEVLLHYGRSLLEVSREEAEPFGDAIPRGDDTSSDSDEEVNGKEEEKEDGKNDDEEEVKKNEEEGKDDKKSEEENKENESKDKESVEKAEEEKKDKPEEKSEAEKKEETPKENPDEDKKEEATNPEDKESKTTTNGTLPENGESSTNGEPSTSEENQEPASDLQIAWEVLEVAKKIFTKRGASGRELLAETHILLGEVAMESENFQEAIQDIQTGIEIQKEVYEPTNRKLAESFYTLGILHSTVTNIDEAVESYNNSINILKKRIEKLKETKDEKTEKKIKEEIEDIEKLIPEIEEKIVDTKSIKEDMASKLLEEMSGEEKKTPPKEEISTSSSSASKAKPNDISHLVKRKRKADDETTEPEKPSKRPTP